MQKAMRSLEGHRHRLREKPSRDVLGKITRPAPAPPVADNKIRPKSSEEVLGKEKVVDVRRSLGIGRIVEEQEEEARRKFTFQLLFDNRIFGMLMTSLACLK